jgi:hypothetical protein
MIPRGRVKKDYTGNFFWEKDSKKIVFVTYPKTVCSQTSKNYKRISSSLSSVMNLFGEDAAVFKRPSSPLQSGLFPSVDELQTLDHSSSAMLLGVAIWANARHAM